ncbi:MAG: hypothetical protein Q4C84_16090 [Bacillota bacterium]|nr:hypothetical protein [Bacillota bacterium]
MSEIIVMQEDDVLILRAKMCMRDEDKIKVREWFKEQMGLNVKIIDGRYDVVGVEKHGERVC